MPGRDGTGPMGDGTMTGRRLGACVGRDGAGLDARMGRGLGRACRRGRGGRFGRVFAGARPSPEAEKELLQKERDYLADRMAAIDRIMATK